MYSMAVFIREHGVSVWEQDFSISRSDLLWDLSLPSDFSFFKKIPTNKMSDVVMMNEIVSPSLWVCLQSPVRAIA